MTARIIWIVIFSISLIAALIYIALSNTAPVSIVRHDLSNGGGTRWRVVQISDMHLSDFGATEKSLAVQVKDIGGDVVVLSGDAIDRIEALPYLRDFIRNLDPVPVLLVPGNWEHWSGVDFQALEDSGAKLLLNDRWTVTRDGRTLLILGLDDFTAGHPDLGLLKSVVSGAVDTLLVQHSPGFFEQAEVNRAMIDHPVRLCLSGHTHGGQIRIGGWAPHRPVGSGRFVAGFYDVPGCRLFVSIGVGTSVLPLRLGARPEFVVFDL